jgi:ABC-2 type transport system ATP-binding protein
MGQKLLTIEIQEAISEIPMSLSAYNLSLSKNGQELLFSYNSQSDTTGITGLLQEIKQAGLKLKDLKSSQTSLENIFEQLLKESS